MTLQHVHHLGKHQMIVVALELIAEPTTLYRCAFCRSEQPHWQQDRHGNTFVICTVCGEGSVVMEDVNATAN